MNETQGSVVLTGNVTMTFEQFCIGGHVENGRCGATKMIIGGKMADHLGCTRRPGHGGKHRIWMRRVGVRGRKHVKWTEPHLIVGWTLAT